MPDQRRAEASLTKTGPVSDRYQHGSASAQPVASPLERVLAEVLKEPLCITAAEIAHRTKLPLGHVIEVLCELEEQGLAIPYSYRRGPEAQAA